MFSPYAAMANNPLLYSDPGGDTTWVFGTAGQYLGTINDKLKNQIHFINNDDAKTKPFDGSKASGEVANKLAQSIRNASVAFIGSKTAGDLNRIASQSTALGKELAFVGSVGEDKEIRLTAMPPDENNNKNSVDVIRQIAKHYPKKEDQSGFFLFGHVHHGGLDGPVKAAGGLLAQQKDLGLPSGADYQPSLYRSANASSQGQTPALIATPYGVTVYGTGTGVEYISWYKRILNQTDATDHSYFLYQNFKK